MTKISRRGLIGAGTVAGGLLAARGVFPAPAIGRELKGAGSVTVYDGGGAWGEAKRIAYFEPFEKETGIKVVRQAGGDVGALRASILAGAPRYDVADVAGSSIQALADEGLLLPIDYGWFDPADKDAFAPVAAGKFGVPALFFSLIIGYDGQAFGENAPKTWADVWDTTKFPGGRSLATGSWGPDGGTYEAALLADGVAPDKLYPIDWDRAFKSLDKIRGSITKFWGSGAEAVQLIADQQVAVGSAWNGRISGARDQGSKIGASWQQGILQWDGWTVPKGTKNEENAMKFIAFASRASNQAVFAQHILYGPTNARAFDAIDKARAALLPTSPDLLKLQVVQNYDFWNASEAGREANYKRAVSEWEKWLAGAR